ncbi:MAG: rRNA maturation RNase YbeY [Planctomycetaceae bacterium]|nr:rRNA maturation RNase YbeY [Planctomycetaceae bacterium]
MLWLPMPKQLVYSRLSAIPCNINTLGYLQSTLLTVGNASLTRFTIMSRDNQTSPQEHVTACETLTVELTAEPNTTPDHRLAEAARLIMADFEIRAGSVSLAIVDDATIHELNRRYLDHDYSTDVLSFVYQEEPNRIDGEVIASTETAARVAAQYGGSLCDELLLYIIHGALHLVGLDDQNEEDRATMRQYETKYLRHFELDTQRIEIIDHS